MNNICFIRHPWCAGAILTLLLTAGCGSTQTSDGANPSPAMPIPASVSVHEAGMVANPEVATKMAPTENLDPLSDAPTDALGVSTTIPVALLEKDYEILFCGSNANSGVTMDTKESVDKINFIKSQSETGNFNLAAKPILNNALGIWGVSFQPVQYNTTLPTVAQPFPVSGGLIMPLGIDKTKVKGIVVYFHGTTFDKSKVGSNYATNAETRLQAEVFASQGYIVAIPDYVGQGIDYKRVHPYVLYPEVTVQTALDMLAAIKPLIINQYQYSLSDLPLKLFSTGYSEGGSYSLWFNSVISGTPARLDSFYNLTHSVGVEGAYSTSVVTHGFLFENVAAGGSNPYNIQSQALTNLVKPVLSADAFLSYATYTLAGDYLAVFNRGFFDLDAIPQSLSNIGGKHIDMAAAFALADTNVMAPVLYAALGKTSNGATYPTLTPLDNPSLIWSPANSVDSLVSATFLKLHARTQLMTVLQAADADLSSVADNGVSILSLEHDSVVVPNNFDALLAKFPTKIKTHIKVNELKLMYPSAFSKYVALYVPVDHLHAHIYEQLYALNIFNSFTSKSP